MNTTQQPSPNCTETAVRYHCTNEPLRAIVLGLDVQPADRILSICGSGDQPLALLENAGEVLAVDSDQRQLNFAINRAKLLAKGDFKAFLGFGISEEWKQEDCNTGCNGQNLAMRDKYFQPERLERIRKKLPGIHFTLDDISKAPGVFDKIYLSNARTYLTGNRDDGMLWAASRRLKPAGRIYVSDFEPAFDGEKLQEFGLEIDRKLTGAVVEYQSQFKRKRIAVFKLQ